LCHRATTKIMTPYDLAYEYVMHTNRCIFLTGKAGTGKTTFLRRLRLECPKQMVVVAPTGVAAINAEGVTIHSLFQLPPQLFLPTPQARAQLFAEMQMRRHKQQLLRSLELLVIDEVSMVRADLMDAIDAVLRRYRHRPNLPFGGVQVLVIGDLYQLSPVARESEWQLLRDYYEGPYFFQAQVLKEVEPIYIELDHVYRQAGDQRFVDILNEVRNNCLSVRSAELLNTRYQPEWQPKQGEPFHIVLSTHNQKVDAINQQELEKLKGAMFTYRAEIKRTFPESIYPMEEELKLKVGARVMFIKNDSSIEKAYYNGKLGIVSELEVDRITVECEDMNGQRQTIHVGRETWENYRYTATNGGEDIQMEVLGEFTHFPLRLAWAVTIHKAQGLTFDHVVIDAADAFASGQVYVALSRCRTLEGMVLLSRIPKHALCNAREVLRFTDKQNSLSDTASGFATSCREYLRQLLVGLYDFRDAIHGSERQRQKVETTESFNGNVAKEYVTRLNTLVGSWQTTAESFQRQLMHILQTNEYDRDYLEQRLQAAETYFASQIHAAIEQIEHSPVYSDNKADSKDYTELLTELYTHLQMKLHMMAGVSQRASVANWFEVRKRFVAPRLKATINGAESEASDQESSHPLLLDKLRKLRYQVAQEQGWKDHMYSVAPTRVLVLISNVLPRTKKELLKVKGFGPKGYALWGERILAIVAKYVEE